MFSSERERELPLHRLMTDSDFYKQKTVYREGSILKNDFYKVVLYNIPSKAKYVFHINASARLTIS